MTRAYLAFTETGLALAKRLSAALPGSVARCGQDGVSLAEWASAQFVQSDALIFVGAAGIAVRAIAPHCKSKTIDPAVVVVDECGRFAVPILSGHLAARTILRGHCRCMRSRACDYHRHRCPRHFCGGRVGKAPKLHGTGAGTHQAGQWQITGRAAGILPG